MRASTALAVLAVCLSAVPAVTPGHAGTCCSKSKAPPSGGAAPGGGNGAGAAAGVAQIAFINQNQFLSEYGKVAFREIDGAYKTAADTKSLVPLAPEIIFGQDQVLGWFDNWATMIDADRRQAAKSLTDAGILVTPTQDQLGALHARRDDPKKFEANVAQVESYHEYLLGNVVAVKAANEGINFRASNPRGVYSNSGLVLRADDPAVQSYGLVEFIERAAAER